MSKQRSAGDVYASLAMSERTTVHSSFAQDLMVYARCGLTGIGITEVKLGSGDDQMLVRALRESGLKATVCVPAVPSILPDPHFFQNPPTVEERILELSRSIRRLAAFHPVAVVVVPGSVTEGGESEVFPLVVKAIQELAGVASEVGVTLAVEPIRLTALPGSLVSTLEAGASLVEAVGADNVGLIMDVWHLWDSPGLLRSIEKDWRRIVAVHISDWRDPTRGPADRLVPGDGLIDLAGIIQVLIRVGYNGPYEIEIMSDDRYDDSLWRMDAELLASRCVSGFRAVWEAALAGNALSPPAESMQPRRRGPGFRRQ
jgi:sugar phosphate isomerase/epimerase